MIETQNHFLANSIALINEMDSEIKDMDHLKIASDEEF